MIEHKDSSGSPSGSAQDPLALRLRFLTAVARSRVDELKEFQTAPTKDTRTAAKTILDQAIDLYLKWKLCRDVEALLDIGTQFQRDNWDKLTEEQRKEHEESLVDLLNTYSEACG